MELNSETKCHLIRLAIVCTKGLIYLNKQRGRSDLKSSPCDIDLQSRSLIFFGVYIPHVDGTRVCHKIILPANKISTRNLIKESKLEFYDNESNVLTISHAPSFT